jgi:hypothetical protein
MNRLGTVLVVAVALTHASPLCAQPPSGEPSPASSEPEAPAGAATPSEQARALFLQGQEAYQHGDYDAAVERWTEAYGLDARPALQYNLAQAYGRLGRLVEERDALERYIESADPEDSLLAAARARVATLRERLARTSIHVEGGVPGAVLLVDGEERGRLPLSEPVSVEPGSHRIEARAEGYVTFRSTAVVPASEVVDVPIAMTAITSAPTPTSSIALFAGGGGALAVGVALGAVAFAKSGDAMDGTAGADRAHAMALTADVLYGVGGAALVTGLVLYLVRGDEGDGDPDATSRVRVAPLITAQGGGLGLGGRF